METLVKGKKLYMVFGGWRWFYISYGYFVLFLSKRPFKFNCWQNAGENHFNFGFLHIKFGKLIKPEWMVHPKSTIPPIINELTEDGFNILYADRLGEN
jgi:hypothetical protein